MYDCTPPGDLGELRTMDFGSSEDESEVIVSNEKHPSTNLHAKSKSPTPKAVNQADSSRTTHTEPLHLKASSLLPTESTLLTSLGRILHDVIPTKSLAVQYDQAHWSMKQKVKMDNKQNKERQVTRYYQRKFNKK